jgi:hypothetical protein
MEEKEKKADTAIEKAAEDKGENDRETKATRRKIQQQRKATSRSQTVTA